MSLNEESSDKESLGARRDKDDLKEYTSGRKILKYIQVRSPQARSPQARTPLERLGEDTSGEDTSCKGASRCPQAQSPWERRCKNTSGEGTSRCPWGVRVTQKKIP